MTTTGRHRPVVQIGKAPPGRSPAGPIWSHRINCWRVLWLASGVQFCTDGTGKPCLSCATLGARISPHRSTLGPWLQLTSGAVGRRESTCGINTCRICTGRPKPVFGVACPVCRGVMTVVQVETHPDGSGSELHTLKCQACGPTESRTVDPRIAGQ